MMMDDWNHSASHSEIDKYLTKPSNDLFKKL